MLILAFESSCDETAAAISRGGREILSSVISTQIDIHKTVDSICESAVFSCQYFYPVKRTVEYAVTVYDEKFLHFILSLYE